MDACYDCIEDLGLVLPKQLCFVVQEAERLAAEARNIEVHERRCVSIQDTVEQGLRWLGVSLDNRPRSSSHLTPKYMLVWDGKPPEAMNWRINATAISSH